MTGKEIKKAFIKEVPVIVHLILDGDIEFEKINKVIYQKDERRRMCVSVECIDKTKNSVVVASARYVRLKYAE